MASNIETQVRTELGQLEDAVAAVSKLCSISVCLPPEHMGDFSFIAQHLGFQLHEQFERFHSTLSKGVLPLVADIKAAGLH